MVQGANRPHIPLGKPSWTFTVWLPCDMHIHKTLGKNTNGIEGQDIPRKIDAYTTDAYYCIVFILHMLCASSAKKCMHIYTDLHVSLIRMPCIFLRMLQIIYRLLPCKLTVSSIIFAYPAPKKYKWVGSIGT